MWNIDSIKPPDTHGRGTSFRIASATESTNSVEFKFDDYDVTPHCTVVMNDEHATLGVITETDDGMGIEILSAGGGLTLVLPFGPLGLLNQIEAALREMHDDADDAPAMFVPMIVPASE